MPIWVVLWGTLGTAASFLCALGDETILGKALFFTSLSTGPLLSMFLQDDSHAAPVWKPAELKGQISPSHTSHVKGW